MLLNSLRFLPATMVGYLLLFVACTPGIHQVATETEAPDTAGPEIATSDESPSVALFPLESGGHACLVEREDIERPYIAIALHAPAAPEELMMLRGMLIQAASNAPGITPLPPIRCARKLLCVLVDELGAEQVVESWRAMLEQPKSDDFEAVRDPVLSDLRTLEAIAPRVRLRARGYADGQEESASGRATRTTFAQTVDRLKGLRWHFQIDVVAPQVESLRKELKRSPRGAPVFRAVESATVRGIERFESSEAQAQGLVFWPHAEGFGLEIALRIAVSRLDRQRLPPIRISHSGGFLGGPDAFVWGGEAAVAEAMVLLRDELTRLSTAAGAPLPAEIERVWSDAQGGNPWGEPRCDQQSWDPIRALRNAGSPRLILEGQRTQQELYDGAKD